MLIYGRNATGKTNFGNALMDMHYTIFTPRFNGDTNLINANSKDNYAHFSYVFDFDDEELNYQYSIYSNHELKDEKLIIDGKTIFSCVFYENEFNFDNLDYVDSKTTNYNIYLQSLDSGNLTGNVAETRLPFLRWLLNNSALKNNSILFKLYNYVARMNMITVNYDLTYRSHIMKNIFYESLDDREKIKDLEEFLNAMGIECKLVLKKLPDGHNELYFDNDKLISFYDNASSGTLALSNLYFRLISNINDSSFVYLDEFDAFYHYEMSENVIKFLKNRYPQCQIIMTTHNTNLMTNRLMRPDCMFILSREGVLTSLCNATKRELREGHNLEKMYISGEFEDYE